MKLFQKYKNHAASKISSDTLYSSPLSGIKTQISILITLSLSYPVPFFPFSFVFVFLIFIPVYLPFPFLHFIIFHHSPQ